MPIGRVSPTGVTEIELIVGVVTVMSKDCVTPFSAAEIVADPAATAVNSPLASMVAVTLEDELQVTRARQVAAAAVAVRPRSRELLRAVYRNRRDLGKDREGGQIYSRRGHREIC